MDMETTTTTPRQFQSYEATLDGKTKVLVINATPITMKATGETVPGLKVRNKIYAGQTGWWSGSKCEYRYGDAYWVRAARVSR